VVRQLLVQGGPFFQCEKAVVLYRLLALLELGRLLNPLLALGRGQDGIDDRGDAVEGCRRLGADRGFKIVDGAVSEG